jgi:hypothetical protein
MSLSTVILMRKRRIMNLLEEAGATSQETAKTLEEIGIVHPDTFSPVTEKLLQEYVIVGTGDGRYYLNQH